MRKFLLASILLISALPAQAQITEEQADAVIANPDRSDYDRGLDTARMPAKALAFMELEEGDRVLDMLAGGGYYTEPIARLVGPDGFVIAQNPPSFATREPIRQAMTFRRYGERLPNAAAMNVDFMRMPLAPASLDAVLFHLVYHDLYFENEQLGLPRTDPQQVLSAIHRALKPGGTVTVIDHVGASDDPRAEVEALHRIDPEIVLRDFQRAGFQLLERETFHENPEDNPSLNVFDEKVRGHTDRVAMRFGKAGDPAVTAENDDANENVPVAGAGSCDAQAAQSLVGQPFGDGVRAMAAELSGAGTVRVYGRGDMVTMDYRPDRLNLELDPEEIIVRVRCG